jgi:hypothetical protein
VDRGQLTGGCLPGRGTSRSIPGLLPGEPDRGRSESHGQKADAEDHK